ncbi:MAG: dihydroneopterin aldolase [Neisseriaceae bacterium]|nr:dihydroneopterin aldolase [Neisseriaceae bacterium]
MQTDTSKAEITDNIDDTVDYSKVYAVIKQEMSVSSHLLEHVGRRIISAIKKEFKDIEKISLKISKLNPPVGRQMDNVSVILEG